MKTVGIKKYLFGKDLQPSRRDVKYQTDAANKMGEYFLKGLGAFGRIITAPFRSQGPTSATIYKSKELLAKERTIENKSEEQLGKAMTWMSPLNYVAAITSGNGFNANKGEEEVASWAPAWQALGRAAELYVGPKGIKTAKAAPRVVVNTAAKAGVKPAKAAVVARELNKGIKQNTNNGRIEVTENYFNSSDKWYRITETPEKYGIMELGKNVTTHDAPQTHGTINGWRSSMLKAPITKSSEGFIKRPQKIELGIRRKNGQAHGNTSQAAKGKLWGGTTSGSNLFPEGIIEGQAPSMINYGIDRTNFVMTPWELVPNGGRVGFHTGEMPMSNLGWFQKTNKGTYTYEPIIPEKRISYQPKLLLDSPTSLKFFERKPFNSKLKKGEEAGVPKSERNNRLHGQTLAPYYDYSLINKHYEPWTVNEKGQFVFASPEESGKLGTIHFSMNEPVMDHFMGSWGDAPTVTIMPYRNMRSQTPPVDIAIMDTFFPNYKGLKVSSKNSKTLTGDKTTYDYYKSKGIDVEFSPEMESLLNEMKDVRSKLDNFTEQEKYGFQPNKDAKTLLDRELQLKEQIDRVSRKWARDNVKTIPSFEKLEEFGRAEGLDMDSYPYQLGNPGSMTTRASRELGLDYTWQSDPSNHSVFLQNPEYILKQIERGEYGKVRPEYIKYLKLVIKHKADYRANPLEALEGFREFDGRTTLGDILGFIDNDIIPRLKELGHQIKSYKPNIRSADFLNDIFDLKMRGENGGAWFSPATNEVTLRGPLENQDFGLAIHETGGHGIRYNMQPDYKPVSREIINKYLTNPEDPTVLEPLLNSHFGREVFNDFEVNTLGDAYPEIAGYFENFTNRLSGKKLSPEAMAKRILDEQGAVNTQFRAKLSENGKLTGKALDKKIQETPEGVILRMEIEQGYTSMGILERISKITGVSMDELNFYNPASLQNLVEKFPELKTIADKVKYAMTHVAVGAGVMYGLNQYGMVELKKKGGKTHKPFGHRSILDNGWQSTKLLKNKKNVYG